MPSSARHHDAGHAHFAARRLAEAVTAYDRAIAAEPDRASNHSFRARALLALGRKSEALASALAATRVDPDSAEAWIALGSTFSGLRQYDLSLKAWRRAQRLAPDHPRLPGLLMQAQMLCCAWDDLDALAAAVAARLASGEDAVHPFYWHAIATSPASLLQAARNWQRAAAPRAPDALPAAAEVQPLRADGRIRIGYLSGELNLSPNGLVMAGVFDHHDHAAFEIVAFDNSIDDGSPLRQRIVDSFDRVIDVRALGDAELAAAIRAAGIDIMVDLNGYFGNSRSDALRLRPAPVQVSYLGCPATSGADHFDYAISDAVVVPDADRQWHSEAIVHLPDSYYPTDRQRAIGTRHFTRAECGLPEGRFVFACFNHCHKLLPDSFARWMRILHGVEGSVLWLLDSNRLATANLRAQAQRHGIAADRLVFAPRMAPEDHLSRHRCADLMLDTLPYNGHTTTTDALWAGLPVLTEIGQTWPGRVAASVLRALDLPELIASDGPAYERRAIELAHHPGALAAIRRRLSERRLSAPLFDTARYTRNLEAAYRAMHCRRCEGLPPGPISVPVT
ncbi:tetratricopeptide repeat protein [Sphingomonas sp.]|uniref:O-linked N-acetylglucosamine transferase, SPINDLY family protein n=1 Tax=Sphingomonas sp. TaxID=28214 RepID=UPI00307F247B